jgi:hypothetical protein
MSRFSPYSNCIPRWSLPRIPPGHVFRLAPGEQASAIRSLSPRIFRRARNVGAVLTSGRRELRGSASDYAGRPGRELRGGLGEGLIERGGGTGRGGGLNRSLRIEDP